MHIPNIFKYLRHKRSVPVMMAVVATLLSGGCTQEGEPDNGNTSDKGKKAVTFGAYVNGTSDTRAGESDINSLKRSGFGVFASITWTEDFPDNPPAGEGFTPNYMYNQKVEWKDNADGGGWVYEPVLFWPGTQKVSFFAYAPYSDQSGSVIKGFSGINDSGSPKLEFMLGNNIDRQVDLLYSSALNLVNSPQVSLVFRHALARIRIRISDASNIDSNTKLSVNKLTFKSTDLGTTGTLNLCTGQWENIGGLTEHVFESEEAFGRGFMIIPPVDVATMEITADYTVTTTDPKLPSGSFESNNVVTGLFSTKLEAGKSYTLNLSLNMQSVEINAVITDWDDDDHTWDSDQRNKTK